MHDNPGNSGLLVGNDEDEYDADRVDDVVCGVFPVDVVVDDVRVVALHVVDDCHGDDDDGDAARNAWLHAKEKTNKDDEKGVVGKVVVNKDVCEDVDVIEEIVFENVVVEDVEDEEVIVNT